MPIPEIQLSTWAKSQQTQLAINTHESIRKALNHPKSKLKLNRFAEGDYFNGRVRQTFGEMKFTLITRKYINKDEAIRQYNQIHNT